ncbi:MAG: Crp/Fnr family transcriptional regulator [Bacteroidia bacterium]
MENLSEFLHKYIPCVDLTDFLDCFQRKIIAKKDFLVRPGDLCDFLVFIDKGLFRVYYYDLEGKEITSWFSFEHGMVTDMLAFYTNQKATFYVEALEDSEVFMITKEQLEELYAVNPEYREFGRRFAEEALAMMMGRSMSLQTLNATERYEELLANPEFMLKIPLKYLASYLGITDTSLSRIRKSFE